MTRWLPLYLRSRRVPLAVAVSAGAIGLLWLGWWMFAGRREVSPNLTVLAIALALAPMIPTLAGDDDALESTAALRWPPRRVLHLIACCALVALLLNGTRFAGTWFGPAWQLVRDSAGLTGLIGLGAALLGTRLAWQLPISWTALQIILGNDESNPVLFWLVQPVGNRPAAVTAGLLFLAGVAAYAWRPGPPTAPVEVTMGQ